MSDHKITALVSGASAGLGAEFCRQLADRCDVIIAVARRLERLQELADSLSGQVEMHCIEADLNSIEGQTRAIEALRQKGPVDYLVNNAGFSTMGLFHQQGLAGQRQMVGVHLDATMALCRAAIPFMVERGSGYVINLSSTISFAPFGGAAVYGASKAFLNHFSEALQQEVAAAGIKVQALCPGFTRTEFHDTESMAPFDRSWVPDDQWMEAQEVVRLSLAALEGDQVIVVPGRDNQAMGAAGVEKLLQQLS